MRMSEIDLDIQEMLQEQGLQDLMGTPIKELDEKRKNGELSYTESGLLSLTAPEWLIFKRSVKDE